jgi:hypothetical protein
LYIDHHKLIITIHTTYKAILSLREAGFRSLTNVILFTSFVMWDTQPKGGVDIHGLVGCKPLDPAYWEVNLSSTMLEAQPDMEGLVSEEE